MIIGITGKAQSGKDTVATMINFIALGYEDEDILDAIDNNSFSRMVPLFPIKKFATRVKDVAYALLHKTPQDYEEFKTSNIAVLGITGRELLQKIGTEIFRDGLSPDIWIDLLFEEYGPLKLPYHPLQVLTEAYQHQSCMYCKSPYIGYKRQNYCKECAIKKSKTLPTWIITDVRFQNEVERITKLGGLIIRVERRGSTDKHPSETEMDRIIPDYILENKRDLKTLLESVKHLYYKHLCDFLH